MRHNLSPDYLQSSIPMAWCPRSCTTGFRSSNSFCINEYLEDQHPPQPALRPARRRGGKNWKRKAVTKSHHAIARLSHAHMMQAKIRDLSAADQKFMLAHTPVPEKRVAMAGTDRARLSRP